jgi:3-phenylpropionate/trans-cinnamate dioxygenase ferredoxin subunit
MTVRPEPEPRDLLLEVENAIAELLQAHGARVSAVVSQLLADIDAVHRAGLTHLVAAVRTMGGDAFVNRLISDPAIRMLMMSYDLVAVDRRLMAEEVLDSVRGHLHGHGIDVEILDVVGGVVYARIHGVAASGLQEDAVARDLQEALRAGFAGFQELVTRERATPAPVMPMTLRRTQRPVYREVLDESDLLPGAITGVEVDGLAVLVVRTASEWLAVANRCGDSPLPLHFSTLDETTLHCSWHGCRYDVRTGSRLDVPGQRLLVYPVSVEHGKVRIAIGVEGS